MTRRYVVHFVRWLNLTRTFCRSCRRAAGLPNACVFYGTMGSSDYLRDAPAARRFVPLEEVSK